MEIMKKLGDILIESGLLTPEKLEEALAEQKKINGKSWVISWLIWEF